jgi:hypothetical protein
MSQCFYGIVTLLVSVVWAEKSLVPVGDTTRRVVRCNATTRATIPDQCQGFIIQRHLCIDTLHFQSDQIRALQFQVFIIAQFQS